MSVRIAVVSQKGGVGKTTVCLNLGLALAEKKRNVVLVDLDPQGGIALSLARREREWAGLAELLMQKIDPEHAVVQTKHPHLRILPRGRLDPVHACEFEQVVHQDGVLAQALAQVDREADYMLIDTPAGFGMLANAALRTSNFALVPFQSEPLAVRSISQVLRVVESIRAGANPNIELLGVLPTMVDAANPVSKRAFWPVWNDFPAVLGTYIPRSDVFAKASEAGLPVAYLGGPVAPEAARFDALADEVERLVHEHMKTEVEDGAREQLSLV